MTTNGLRGNTAHHHEQIDRARRVHITRSDSTQKNCFVESRRKSVHITRRNSTKQFCRVVSGDVNALTTRLDSTKQFLAILNIFSPTTGYKLAKFQSQTVV